ncbi:hypothetical protein K488DRAFT_64110, partial [Vararia minispora EC-137]
MFSDPLFSRATDPSTFSSPLLSGSPDGLLSSADVDPLDPEKLAKDDPLATQVWKMYARTKANLPHAQRMENLTWRMMALALKKQKEDEARQAAAQDAAEELKQGPPAVKDEGGADQSESAERGRRIDKGKSKVSIVGFDGTNQDGTEEDDDALVPMDWRAMSRSRSRVAMDWRPLSRSRSRPPGSAAYAEQHTFPDAERFAFPSFHDAPTTGAAARNAAAGRQTPPPPPQAFGLPPLHEHASEQQHLEVGRYTSSAYLDGPLDLRAAFAGHPASLPSFGLAQRVPTARSPEDRSFPRHVRKTSFDHTVSKEGIVAGPRRAQGPHGDSMLRADPACVT